MIINKKQILKYAGRAFSVLGAFILLLIVWEIYIPVNFLSKDSIVYTAPKGWGDDEIAQQLEEMGIIKSSLFFRGFVIATLQHGKVKAGKYSLSPSMSTAEIVRKLVQGDVIRQKVTILEGWDKYDIAKYLEEKEICTEEEFLNLAQEDFSRDFPVLTDKPRDIGLEGYLFPDTYQVSLGEEARDVMQKILTNFDKKLTPELREEIAKQKKSVFEIITMASIIEKEVRSLNDKKIVSGILWKRLSIDMPLQVDSTVNYITGKSDAGVAIKDTKIDSPYNTYKYKGLPAGPISNPGIDSITAAVYPTKTEYLYYLSASGSGRTIFSKTFEQHNIARAQYLR